MQKHLGGGNSIMFGIFIPKIWGRWTHFDVHIFEMGWFNHQLDTVCFHSLPWFATQCSRLRALRHAVSRALDAAAAANLTGEGVPAGKKRWWSIPVVGWWLIKDSLKWLLKEHHIFFAALLLEIVVFQFHICDSFLVIYCILGGLGTPTSPKSNNHCLRQILGLRVLRAFSGREGLVTNGWYDWFGKVTWLMKNRNSHRFADVSSIKPEVLRGFM